MTKTRPLVSSFKDQVGNFLAIFGLLFAVKVTALGAIYSENQKLLGNIDIVALCVRPIDTHNLKFLVDNAVPLLVTIDVVFAVLAIIPLFVAFSAIRSSVSWKELQVKDFIKLGDGVPVAVIFSVMMVFSFANSGVTGLLHGMSDATLENAPKVQSWWDGEDRTAVCRYMQAGPYPSPTLTK